MSRRDELTPEAARELAVVDRALAGAPVPPDLTRLEDLVLSLRAERPVPRREFAADLDERVERGFGASEHESAADDSAADSRIRVFVAGLRARRRAVPLALGSAASVFIVAVALISGGGDAGNREQPPEGQPSVAEPAVPEKMSRDGGGGSVAAPHAPSTADREPPALGVAPTPPPASARGDAPRARERKIERAASLTLGAAPGEVEDVADEVVRVTDRYRGFVLASNVSSGSEGARGATLDLRLPAGSLRAALADLSELGHVRSRTQSTQDVTAVFVSARGRLRDALAERRGLLRQLEQADTLNETASVRARLRSANRRIGRARTQLRRVSDRVDYASLAVAIEPDGQSADDGSGWTPGDALDDALVILGAALGAALVVLAVALPLALLALVAWLAFGRLARTRRERALDGAAGD